MCLDASSHSFCFLSDAKRNLDSINSERRQTLRLWADLVTFSSPSFREMLCLEKSIFWRPRCSFSSENLAKERSIGDV